MGPAGVPPLDAGSLLLDAGVSAEVATGDSAAVVTGGSDSAGAGVGAGAVTVTSRITCARWRGA